VKHKKAESEDRDAAPLEECRVRTPHRPHRAHMACVRACRPVYTAARRQWVGVCGERELQSLNDIITRTTPGLTLREIRDVLSAAVDREFCSCGCSLEAESRTNQKLAPTFQNGQQLARRLKSLCGRFNLGDPEAASAIRAQLPAMQDEEIITELYWLAVHYEQQLAVFADSGLVQD
jgi:hypothetical protein